MWRLLHDQIAFFREFRSRFETTGAIAPSSSALARSMTRFLAERSQQIPIRVLEVGPGTGPVTDKIIPHLKGGDTFDLVELNAAFAERLKQRFDADPHWREAASFSRIHELPVQDFHSSQKYDFIVSGLPLNNFPSALVETITSHYFQLLKPGGMLSYFEYMYVRPIRRRLTRGPERERIVAIDDHMRNCCDRFRICRDSIWRNIPPAWVQHLRMPDSTPSGESAKPAVHP
jgi:phosphatidylethanolamine/phosphatidyl-N-methylethanolamine N-methyltransferase